MINNNSIKVSVKQLNDDKLLNRSNFDKIFFDFLDKYKLSAKMPNNEIFSLINNGLETYMKTLLEKLIIISRARNVNVNINSKLTEKHNVK